jgi:hypothetical protein
MNEKVKFWLIKAFEDYLSNKLGIFEDEILQWMKEAKHS